MLFSTFMLTAPLISSLEGAIQACLLNLRHCLQVGEELIKFLFEPSLGCIGNIQSLL